MEYDPIKDKLFRLTRNSIFMREALFTAIGHLFLREGHVKRRIAKLPIPERAMILDAGCGLGQYSLWLAKNYPNATIFAADVKQHFIDAGNEHAKAKGYSNLTFGSLDLLNLEERDRYDFILTVDVMEHIEHDVDLMTRYCRALKPGGMLLIHTPSSKNDSRLVHHDEFLVDEHVREGYSTQEMMEKLAEAGFAKSELYPSYHPTTGKLLWWLWQNIPLQFTRLGKVGYLLIPVWLVVAYPIGYPLWWRDLHLGMKEGSGMLAIAYKGK